MGRKEEKKGRERERKKKRDFLVFLVLQQKSLFKYRKEIKKKSKQKKTNHTTFLPLYTHRCVFFRHI